MLDSIQFLFKSFNLNLGKISIPIPYWEAFTLVVLIFFLIVSLAQIRKEKVDWSFKGGIFGIIFGFLLALVLEGFLVIQGNTFLTNLLGWKNPPAPISHVLDAGKEKLIQVLGVQTQVQSADKNVGQSVQNVLQTVQKLNPADVKKIKNILCAP